jgi:hypothetical protein
LQNKLANLIKHEMRISFLCSIFLYRIIRQFQQVPARKWELLQNLSRPIWTFLCSYV